MNHLSPNFWFPDPSLMPQSHHHHHDSVDDGRRNHHEREPMFEKPLTPSDVGKLNRLVIPKHNAEKYFPLGGEESGEKGLLLSFEDEMGKCWRFRYSYWSSSQSYVLTKGWSRYVKEKRLDAGDVVLFQRHREDSDRLFIGWRRRGAGALQIFPVSGQRAAVDGGGGGLGWGGGCRPANPYDQLGLGLSHQPPAESVVHVAGSVLTTRGHTTPTPSSSGSSSSSSSSAALPSSGNLKTLRLFGVNLEC